jgi:hypothetical protein
MLSQRQRPILWAMAALVAIWVIAMAGYEIARNARVTPERIRAYTAAMDFSRLSAAQRAAAVQKLAAMLNALTLKERQSLRPDRTAWFKQMTEDEKEKLIEATMPTGIKQMLNAFEALPPDKQQHAVNDAIQQMKSAQAKLAAGESPPPDDNGPPLSPELQEKLMKEGLQSFYSQSSAQTKAELAPLLEQMQQMMETGRLIRQP